ncbi:DCC1-like thiol-disulfide oxidoreductase family protein [Serratia marcescens]|nr:DCC1-like thiol-disulfide oxidoreductase family protein [Serratia marcescens]
MTPLSQLPYLQPGERALLFDGECNLCHGLVRDLIRADRQRRILLATVQSVEGQAILLALGLPTDRFDSVVYVEQGRYWLRSAALFQALRQLAWPYARWRWGVICRRSWRTRCTTRSPAIATVCLAVMTAAVCRVPISPGAICLGGGSRRPELYASLPSNRLKYQHSSSI